ncbi:MAG: YHYH protein [Myxococcota bacterium]
MSRRVLLLVPCVSTCLLAWGCGDDEASPDAGAVDASTTDSSMDVAESDIDPMVCSDDSRGSGTTPTPVASGAQSFTTELQGCSLSAAEAAFCYGASHESTVVVEGGVRMITGNAIPNHDVDLFPNAGNPNAIRAQSTAYSVTTTPTKTATATPLQVPGVVLNGIKMEPATAESFNSEGVWRYAALTFGGRLTDDTTTMPGTTLGVDCNFAHVQPTGEYHYHGNPTGLTPTTPAVTHIGWAADGFPVFARYGYETPGDISSPVAELTGSYRVRDGARVAIGTETVPGGDYDGTFEQDWVYDETVGDLDECNGRDEMVTVDGETFEYAYYLTHTYPFMPRCVWGTPDDSFVRRPGGGMMPPGM